MLVHSFHQLIKIEDKENNIVFTDCYVNDLKLIDACNFIVKNEKPFELQQSINFHKGYCCNLFANYPFQSPYSDVKLFLDHINSIVYNYANLFNLMKINIRLELLNKNTCVLYHHDHVDKRLICTLSGNGTEYLEDNNVTWDKFHHHYSIPEDKNSAIIKDLNQVKQLKQLEIAIMKGCNGNSANGLIHKAPSCNDDNRRLILVID